MVHCFKYRLYFFSALIMSVVPQVNPMMDFGDAMSGTMSTEVPVDTTFTISETPQVTAMALDSGSATSSTTFSTTDTATQPPTSSPDAPPPSQLTWPDTAEMKEDQAKLAPAANNNTVKELFDNAQKAVETMTNTVNQMNTTRQELYTKLFALNDIIDDHIQSTQKTIGAVTQIFNQADKLKD
jgi:hypothetical protein